MSRRIGAQEFIERAKSFHGSRYDYSKVVYISCDSKVIISCPEHGDFNQTPSHHLRGHGCLKCAGVFKNNTSDFIKKAKAVHGDLYAYNETIYTGAKNEVIITCSLHGNFNQMATRHLNGQGCPKCGGHLALTTESFVEKAKGVHGNKYDYSKTIYRNVLTKVTITCPAHGDFNQLAGNHLIGYGCSACGHDKVSKENLLDTETFVSRARQIHGNKYNYSETKYVNARHKVAVCCSKHGIFKQSPTHHLNGQGCPKCRESQGEIYIGVILKKRGVNFIPQMTFNDCRLKRNLRFDFYLPSFNTVIEFNGRQHYEPIDTYGGQTSFNLQQKRDCIKRAYCQKKGIKFFEIKYSDNLPLRLSQILDKELNKDTPL